MHQRGENKITNTLWVALLLSALAVSSARSETITGKVVGVADGDTITVLDAVNAQHKIRLSGIDAPEKAQPFGQRSKAAMSALVFGKEVDVVAGKRDRYGRLIGRVLVAQPSCTTDVCPKTVDAGLAQLTLGMAWWYRHYAREQSAADAGAYEIAEHAARAHQLGLWRDAEPVAPWDWRHPVRR